MAQRGRPPDRTYSLSAPGEKAILEAVSVAPRGLAQCQREIEILLREALARRGIE